MINILKDLFDKFLQDTEPDSVRRYDKKEMINLNADVFEFQAYVAKRLKSQSLNLLLNPSVHSEGITSSFNKQDVRPFTADEYCLAFFDFLNVNRHKRLELFELIELFIDLHKDEFNWQDIIITASGATRCRTNLRFALNRLRRIGLIQKLNQAGKRVFLPTLSGELVFFCWRKQLTKYPFSPEALDKSLKELTIRNCEFHKLFNLLQKITAPDDRDVLAFFGHKEQQQLFVRLEEILKDIKTFLQNSTITEHGILFKDDKE